MTLEDLYRLLRAGHVQAQGIVDTIRQPLVVLDSNLCVVSANPAFFHTFLVSREETLGECFTKLGNGQWDIPAMTHLLHGVIPKSAAVIGYEVSHDFPGIGLRTILVTARRMVHPDDNSLFMLVVFEDVTDSRRKDTARDLIVAEIEHRLKNFLALVSALARRIPAKGEGAAEYRDSFLARLEVLTGAEAGLFSRSGNDLAALVASVLAPYRERTKIGNAPPVTLERSQVRSFSMILHELATNALKYGALSADRGIVHMSWTLTGADQHWLIFDWREEGGPATSTPSSEGFGTGLIKSLVKMDLGGTIESRFEVGGLQVRIEAPLSRSDDSKSTSS